MGMYGKKAIDESLNIVCGPGLTKQSFKEDTDINKILAKFAKTGMIEALNSKEPFYGDVSMLVSYQDSLNVVKQAEDLFSKMSPEIRDKFEGDPGLMIDYLNDPKNYDEAVKLGMVIPKPVDVVEAGKEGVVGVAPSGAK